MGNFPFISLLIEFFKVVEPNPFLSMPNYLPRVLFLKFLESWIKDDMTISICGELLDGHKVCKKFRDISLANHSGK